MSLSNTYVSALEHANLFQSYEHLSRFKELMDCYSGFPFFSKGLGKCMYLSAWDEVHFTVILEILNAMVLGKDKNTKEMTSNGESLAMEQTTGEYYIYLLSLAFLENKPYQMPDDSLIEPENKYILLQALRASQVIDNL